MFSPTADNSRSLRKYVRIGQKSNFPLDSLKLGESVSRTSWDLMKSVFNETLSIFFLPLISQKPSEAIKSFHIQILQQKNLSMLCAIEAPHIQVQNSHCNKWIWYFMVLLLEEKVSNAHKDPICCSDTYANCSGIFFLCSLIASLLAENLSVLPIFKLPLLLFSEYVLMLLYHHWKRRKEGLGLPRNSKVKSKGT